MIILPQVLLEPQIERGAGRLVRVVFSVCVLLGEKLDDEDLVYVDRDFLANRFAQQGSAELLQVLLDIGELETAQILEIGSDRLVVARLLAQGNDVALVCKHKREYRRSEEHTSELQSRINLVCRLLLEKKK